jgi:hypothetical protein
VAGRHRLIPCTAGSDPSVNRCRSRDILVAFRALHRMFIPENRFFSSDVKGLWVESLIFDGIRSDVCDDERPQSSVRDRKKLCPAERAGAPSVGSIPTLYVASIFGPNDRALGPSCCW